MNTLLDFIPKIRNLGDREALCFYNGYRTWKLNYITLYRRAAGLADHFLRNNVDRGDRVLIWGENRPEWVVAFWAAVSQGVEVIPLDPGSSHSLVKRIREESGAKLLIHGETVDTGSLSIETLSFSEMAGVDERDHLETRHAEPDDVVEILYTSGTTGTPRGVVHRHRNLCANLRPFEKEISRYRKLARPFQPIRLLNMLPLSHMFGQSAGLFIPILLEGSIVFMQELHPTAMMETIRNQRVSVVVTVPRLLSQLKKHIERKFEVSDQRVQTRGVIGIAQRWWRFRQIHSQFGWKFWAISVGGARLPTEIEEFWSKLGFLVIQGYGLTEASPIVAVNHPFKSKPGSLGQVIEGQEVRIAPDGEILVRGESVVDEYLKGTGDSEAGAPNGWLHTGDIGEIDSEGYLRYRGRKKDVIVTSEGFNVYPDDVETVLNQLPSIVDSVVITERKDGDEIVHAVLLLRDPSIGGDQLVREANQQLEPHQRIRSWSIWSEEDFPRTSSTFKTKRFEVARRMARESEGRPDRQNSEHTSGSLEDILARMCGPENLELHENMRLSEDLGLSSLDRMDLLSRLEDRSSVDLDESTFSQLSTIGELKQLLDGTVNRAEKAGPTEGRTQKVRVLQAQSDQSPTIATSALLPRWNRSLLTRTLRFLIQQTLILPLYRHSIDFTVTGRETLQEIEPPVIFAANHVSHLDTVAVLAALPLSWRSHLAPAMLQEYFSAYLVPSESSGKRRINSALQYYLACGLFNGYPLPQRMGGIRRALKYSGELVEHGFCPLIFPEGMRSPDGSLQSFKPGVGMMALRLKVPVIPLYIEGLFEVFSLHHRWPTAGPVRVVLGTPVDLTPAEDYETATAKIEAGVRELALS